MENIEKIIHSATEGHILKYMSYWQALYYQKLHERLAVVRW